VIRANAEDATVVTTATVTMTTVTTDRLGVAVAEDLPPERWKSSLPLCEEQEEKEACPGRADAPRRPAR